MLIKGKKKKKDYKLSRVMFQDLLWKGSGRDTRVKLKLM